MARGGMMSKFFFSFAFEDEEGADAMGNRYGHLFRDF